MMMMVIVMLQMMMAVFMYTSIYHHFICCHAIIIPHYVVLMYLSTSFIWIHINKYVLMYIAQYSIKALIWTVYTYVWTHA